MQIGDIIVTAQRRSESINKVGMTIAAVTGDELLQKQISSPSDLQRIIPGFTAQPTPYAVPVYTLRGVGFYDYSLAASPSVSVYLDEVPLPYSSQTKGISFDLDRVEVLKGPQGTLFGQSATGGAINYIAAKPTAVPKAGFDMSFGRFNTLDTSGFVSGPLTGTLNARLAVRTVQSSEWQKSYTRDDELGDKNQFQGRLLLDWQPTDRLSVMLNLNGWTDDGDTQAPQLVALDLQGPPLPELTNYPLPPQNARAADWNRRPLRRHDRFLQASGHLVFKVSDAVHVDSITAFSKLRTRSRLETDGFSFSNLDVSIEPSFIESFTQELRLSGDTDRFNWTAGASYGHDRSSDVQRFEFDIATNNRLIPGVIDFELSENFARQRVDTYAAFAHAEYQVLDTVKIRGGIRYTDIKRAFQGCQNGAGAAATASSYTNLNNIIRAAAGLPPLAPLGINDCATLNADTLEPGVVVNTLKEDSVSWTGGVDWTPASGLLFYATVSKGYKGGGFPTLGSLFSSQYDPVVQEELLAYEGGFKLSLLDRTMQLNGAAFYYDYKNKQVRGKIPVPIFNLIESAVNVPKSKIAGAEGQIIWAPVKGLNVSGSATYLSSKIKRFTGFAVSGVTQDFAGSRLPFTPTWTANGDIQYEWRVSDRLHAFGGASLAYSSSTNASIGYPNLYTIPSYTTLDLNIGIKSADSRWRATLWGRNVTNEYYWLNVQKANDTIIKYAAMPATYGASFSYRF